MASVAIVAAPLLKAISYMGFVGRGFSRDIPGPEKQRL